VTAGSGGSEGRQAAERAARERAAGTLIGAAGELGVAVAQRAAAAATEAGWSSATLPTNADSRV